ncbi:hypothetical protein [Salinactinospora qingdaonensis]|uniref:Uncharacterized protein n=1 Tax=Salinactinospora qingdaonensis TaxID=702744 RepID=A0ABP7GE64_9ACTN
MSSEENPLFELLRSHYGDRWNIRRSAHLWIATAQDSDAEYAPTVVEPDVEEFVRQLENPPAAAGRSMLAASRFRDQFDQVDAAGIYHRGGPPRA